MGGKESFLLGESFPSAFTREQHSALTGARFAFPSLSLSLSLDAARARVVRGLARPAAELVGRPQRVRAGRADAARHRGGDCPRGKTSDRGSRGALAGAGGAGKDSRRGGADGRAEPPAIGAGGRIAAEKLDGR